MKRERSEAEAYATEADREFGEGVLVGAMPADEPLLDLADRLRRTALPASIDPRFRASLRQRLVQSTGVADLTSVRYAEVDTAIGRLHVAYRGRVICGVSLGSDDLTFEHHCITRHGFQPRRETEPPVWLITLVRSHLEGRRTFKGAVHLAGLLP